MKLQKASLCALYAVLELAADPERQLSAMEIAVKYGMSTNHLAKVLRTLGRAKLVESARGAGGGYRFVGNAKRVTLLDIIDLFEDIGPTSGEGSPDASTEIGAEMHAVLSEIDDIAKGTLRSITIETLLKHMRKRRERSSAREHGEPRMVLAE